MLLLSRFSPLKVPGCRPWIQPGQHTTVVSGDISAIGDCGSYAMDALQTDPTMRPALGTINGRSAIDGAAGGKFLTSGALSGLTSPITKICICMVLDVNTSASIQGFFHLVQDRFFLFNYFGSIRCQLSGNYTGYFSYANTNPMVLTVLYNGNELTDATRLIMRLNGNQQSLSFSGGSIPASVYTISSYIIGAYSTTPTYAFDGKFGAIDCLFGAVWTDDQIHYLERGFGREYGITVA